MLLRQLPILRPLTPILSPRRFKSENLAKLIMGDYSNEKYPIESLKPKHETNVTTFRSKFPSYDGRDVIIAILDSGVDPKASGLLTLPNGDTKVIERFDCSGCGDVVTDKLVTASDDNTITGLSGRKLTLSSYIRANNATGDYRVGLKSLLDLYPSRVREKIIADAKHKQWDEPHKRETANIARALSEFDVKNSNSNNLSFKDKQEKENLDAYQEFLTSCDKKFSEVKTCFDCVLFKSNKSDWIAVIDTTETGDLENAIVIREYSKFYDMVKIDDYLSISINVHNDGDTLEIVGMCSSHGTHVASIACGYDRENEDLSGVAPGTKVVSLTIGDGRLGSMETGTGLVRAIIKMSELCDAGKKIDVVNMSYGEHAGWSNSGRVGELMAEFVNRYGVCWVSSAGNHGPALSTIGTPPDISTDACIGIGAYVSPEMMEAEYALRQTLPGNVYTWSSRDPCFDGGSGVTVCAPGAAIASVPEFTHCRAQLMNGTSMSAPHVAGAICLMISGLKQRGIVYTPYSIKRALWNSATHLSSVDVFAQGNGLLNVEKCFEHLMNYKDEAENCMRFVITVGSSNKGIHMRSGVLNKPEEFNVNVEPLFFNEKYAAPKDKIEFNLRLALVPSHSWIQCGKFIDLCYQSRSFIVRVDPTKLSPGVYRGRVRAYDTAKGGEKGSVFEVPITVVQPHVVDSTRHEFIPPTMVCKPNTIIRDFILVPDNATYAVLEMISCDAADKVGGKFLVHTLQMIDQRFCKHVETAKILPVNGENVTMHPFKCVGGNIVEVCIAKYWSNIGEVPLQYRVRFHGFKSNNAHIMHASNGIHRIDVTALLPEELQPSISLKHAVVVLKPVEAKISALSRRDVIPNERQIFQNILTYSLHVAKNQELSLHAPLFSSVLYESEFESQFWMIFDSNKMLVQSGDAYSGSNYFKLDKGDYTVKMQVRHEKKELLEKVNEATLHASFKLSSSLNMDIYRTHNNAVVCSSKKASSFTQAAGFAKPIYIAPLPSEKVLKNVVNQCSWFEGQFILAKDEFGRKVDINTFQYVLPEGGVVKKSSNGANSAPKDVKSKSDEYKEGLRDFQCQMIAKLDGDEVENLYDEVLAANPGYVGTHLSLIQSIETSTNSAELKNQLPNSFSKQLRDGAVDVDELKTKLNRILQLADLVIDGINVEALLAYFGLKSDNRPDAAKIKQQMDKQKQQLVDAYLKKAVAMGKLSLIQQHENSAGENVGEELDNVLIEMTKFVDVNDLKYVSLLLWQSHLRQHQGRMLKYLQKLYDDKLNRDVLEEMSSIAQQKGWGHIESLLKRITVAANPQNYRAF